ncbi:DNA-protecting protein DprA [Klebsiella pneumoniae]|nr:DNA-protecting protein DprA [Klebsiella pneumoniae subsp. pneumoniae]MDQ6191552.1 DNA-protecting protein DprA [Klebsiella pneumoniae]
MRRTKKLVKCLVKDGFTIVSGLAEGVDTCAHETALEMGGNTIAVIGTPLSHNYPKQNVKLQKKIRENFCLSAKCHSSAIWIRIIVATGYFSLNVTLRCLL